MAIMSYSIRLQDSTIRAQLERYRLDEFDNMVRFNGGALGDQLAIARAHFDNGIGLTGKLTLNPDKQLDAGDFWPSSQILVPPTIAVPTTLAVGQVAIIQFNSDDADDPHIPGTQNMTRDSISFVLLAPVGSGTILFFTDRSWNGTVLGASGGGEGTYTWTAGADMAAGTVITITEAELTAAGIELIDTGEAIYVYQGANLNTPTTFLHAVEYGDLNDAFGASLANTGLVAGTSALAIAEDNGSFGERLHHHQLGTLFQNINSHLNWHTNENSPQTNHVEGTNLFVAPEVQVWIAGISGGHGLMSLSIDPSQNGGLGYNVQTHFQNTAGDGNGLTTTSRFWSPTHILFDTVDGKFFIVDSSGTNDRMLQGNISDLLNNPGIEPPMTILYSEQPAVSDGIGLTGHVLDIANNHIYFTRNNVLMRVNYDTANQTPTTLIDLGMDSDTGNANFANEIALDLANGRAFIISTESFSDFVEIPPGSGNIVVGTVMHQNSIHMVSNIATGDTGVGNNVHVQLNFTEAYDDDNNAFGDQLNEFDNALGKITSIDINQLTGEIWFTTVQLNAGTDGSVGGIYRATLSGNTLNVTTIYTENNATNFNFLHIHVDEETGFYYVTSQEPGEQGQHSLFRGALNAAAGTAPTFIATVGNINEMTPRDLTVESAPTVTANSLAAAVTEASSAPNSGLTAGALLFSAVTASDIDTVNGTDEFAGAQVRITNNFQTGATHQDSLRITGVESGTIAGSGIAFSYNATTGVLTLSGPGTAAEYQAALALVTFHTSGDNVTNYGQATTRTVAASVFDGLLYSDEITNTVSVTGINDAPVNVAAADSGDEDTTVFVNGLSISDVDANPASQNMTVTLTVARGTLTVSEVVPGGLVAADIANNGTATVTLTGTQQEINTTLGNALGVAFSLGAHGNGTVLLTITTDDGGFNGNDPGVTPTGTSEQDSDQVTITVNAINDAPTVVNGNTQALTAIFEDQPSAAGQSIDALLQSHYSDALDNQSAFPGGSSAGDFTGIAVVSSGSSASGEWQYSTNGGANWTNIGTASLASAKLFNDATLIRFLPAQNFNGPAPALTVHLIDNSGAVIVDGVSTANLTGATGGTTRYSADTVTLSQQVDPVNDAPTSTNIHNDSVTWTEGDSAVRLDLNVNATIADVDSANFDGGTLTVTISVGAVPAEDGLFINHEGNGPAQIGVSGNTVSFGGVQFATFTGGGFGGGNIVFTFDADATPTIVQTLIRAMQYNNNGGDNPTAGARLVSWTLVDGDGNANSGADTLLFSTTVNVVATNDAPAINNLGGDSATYTEEGPAVFLDSSVAATVTDVDSVNFDTGSLTVSITANEVAAEDVLAISTAGTVTLSAGMTVGSIVSVGGTAIGTITSTGASGADLVVAFNASATPALVSTLVQALTYANTNTTTPSILARTVSVTVTDGDGGSDSETVTVSVVDTPENAPPVVDLNGAGTGGVNNSAAYTENGASVLLSPADLIVTDADSANLTGATVQITGGFVPNLDRLTVGGAVSGTIGGITFSYHPASGVLTLTGTDTLANYQAVLRQVGFDSTSEDPGTTRTISWIANDGNGPSATATTTITVTPINDEPTLSATGANPTFTEDLPAVDLFTGVSVSAVEAGQTLTSMTLTVTNVTDGAFEILYYDGTFVELTNGNNETTAVNGLSVTVSVAANVATVTFTSVAGITPALLRDLIDNIAYINDSPDPTDADRVVTITQIVDSGSNTSPNDNVATFSIASTVNVDPVNDGPSNGVPGPQTFNEGGSVTFSSGGGNAIVITDSDANPADITVTLAIADGTLSLNPGALAALTSVTGDGSNNVVLSGTVAEVNAALNGLVYVPPTNANGPRTLSVQTSDNGNSPAPALTDNDSISITINPVNDAPSGTSNAVTGSEDDPYVFTAADFGFSDPVEGHGFLAVRIMSFPANGTLFLDPDGGGANPPINLQTVGAGVFVNVSDINLGRLYFQPDADEFGNGYASFNFQVQDNGGILNGGVDIDPTENTMTINIVADNAAPVVDLDSGTGGLNYTTTFVEDGAAVAIGSGVSVTDANSGTGDMIESATITLTDRVAGDSLILTGALPPGIVATTTLLAGSITIEIVGPGTGAQYQALIQSIQYSSTNQDPTVGGTDPARTVTVTVSDGTLSSAVATTTINVTATDDPAAAQPDAFTITESGSIVAGNLFADNGSGADSDPDGPPLSITAVNGSAGNVGTVSPFLLPSGASLQVFANGTFNYNPNNVFLPTPTAGSGASNTPSHDSFTYTLAGGNTVTVTITLTGLDTDDYALGTAGVDIIHAGGGNDTIDGLAGADTLTGGLGDDFIYVTAGDTIVDAVGDGYDNVLARETYVLNAGAFTEVLSTDNHAGTALIHLTGNALNNILIGNAAGNILDGGGGTDRLAGLGGNDFLIVDSADDVVDEGASGGYDNVLARVSYTLTAGAHVEVLSTDNHAGTGFFILTGNELDNIVIGNAGANILDGGNGGLDRLAGFGGDDFLIVGTGDIVDEAVGGGYDNVLARSHYELTFGQEIEVLSTADHDGTQAINLTGNEFANIVLGNAGANTLNGSFGHDRLDGLGGEDRFAFTTNLSSTFNVDTIIAFDGGDGGDMILIDNAVFTGLALGALDPNAFVIGTAATTADHRIIYDATTGALYFDADGNGVASEQVQFAILDGAPVLTSADFLVI